MFGVVDTLRVQIRETLAKFAGEDLRIGVPKESKPYISKLDISKLDISKLANLDWRPAVADDIGFARGVNVYAGQICRLALWPKTAARVHRIVVCRDSLWESNLQTHLIRRMGKGHG